MNSTTETADPAMVRWAAEQVIRQHSETAERMDEGAIPLRQTGVPSRASGGCAQCDGSDPACRMLVWARAELAALAGPESHSTPGDPRREG
jgi:hypothetical protein